MAFWHEMPQIWLLLSVNIYRYCKNSIINCTMLTIITSRSRVVYYTRELISPKSDKWDRNSVQRSANSTRSVVAVVCRLTVCIGKTNCHIGPLDVLGMGVTASCFPLPSCHSPRRAKMCRRVMYAPANTTVCVCRHARECMQTHTSTCLRVVALTKNTQQQPPFYGPSYMPASSCWRHPAHSD